ncbi:hypothetical protein PM082_007743 [Marasmius tenuissimus]|nr:hypothetical protein PM082_007743 [Marasmius tenuissimus]
MSFKRSDLYPPNPITERGKYTKLSANKNKIVYANGKSVIVREVRTIPQLLLRIPDMFRIRLSRGSHHRDTTVHPQTLLEL